MVAWFVKASDFHSVNYAPSANGGSNTAWVWYIERSEVETLCRNSNCSAPGAAMPLRYPHYLTFDPRSAPELEPQGRAW